MSDNIIGFEYIFENEFREDTQNSGFDTEAAPQQKITTQRIKRYNQCGGKPNRHGSRTKVLTVLIPDTRSISHPTSMSTNSTSMVSTVSMPPISK